MTTKEKLAEEHGLSVNGCCLVKKDDSACTMTCHEYDFCCCDIRKAFLAGYEAAEERAKVLVDALGLIVEDYLEEGIKNDCPGCDYDGRIQLTHHDQCVYVVAREALSKYRSE